MVGQQLTLWLSLPLQADSIAIPASALYGNNSLYIIEDGRMQSVKVKRLGQLSVDGQVQLLVKSEVLTSGTEIITTHLPNAISGLRVQSVNPNSTQDKQHAGQG